MVKALSKKEVLLGWYKNQTMQVKWGICLAGRFTISDEV